MTALLIYMLKSALVLALLTLTYRMTLRRETFHRFNRAILLAIAAVSFIVPAVSLSTASPSAVNMAISHAETWLQVPATVTAHPAKGEGSPSSYLPLLIASLYLLGLVATLLRYALQYIGLMRLFRRSRRVTQLNGLSIHLNDALPAPVSWMNYIFLSPDDYRKHADYLLRHEVAHARQRHTLDIIAGQAVTALQWFNPAAHLWMNDLRAVHEFLADRAASPPDMPEKPTKCYLSKKP